MATLYSRGMNAIRIPAGYDVLSREVVGWPGYAGNSALVWFRPWGATDWGTPVRAGRAYEGRTKLGWDGQRVYIAGAAEGVSDPDQRYTDDLGATWVSYTGNPLVTSYALDQGPVACALISAVSSYHVGVRRSDRWGVVVSSVGSGVGWRMPQPPIWTGTGQGYIQETVSAGLDDPAVHPLPDGRWECFAITNDTLWAWRSTDAIGTAWEVHRQDSIGPLSAGHSGLGFWQGRSGTQVLCGITYTAGPGATVYLWYRDNPDGPFTMVNPGITLGGVIHPYSLEHPTGGWEFGHFDETFAWHQWTFEHPGGIWSPI